MPSLVIIGAQWGDEGKGKIVDALADQADVVVRFQGGDNAGHTVFHDGQKFVFHILPCGILRPRAMNLIGGGVVVNPTKLTEELAAIRLPESAWRRRLRISGEAHLILDCHLALDQAAEARRGSLKIGTTQRGIGPAYADRAARTGVRMGDSLEPDYFRARVKICLDSHRALLPKERAREVCDVEKVTEETLALLKPFRDLIVDTGVLLDTARRNGKHILYEGAQGTMLDIGAGTYPYVTSSHTIAGGVCVGTGIGPHAIDRILGVSKAYATRVGEGPFTTELHDATGEILRSIGGEYGATTKRPRRCGWLDIVQLRRAARLNSLDGLILTKLDVLDGLEQIGVCTAYRCGGKRYTEWPANPVDLAKAEPVYTFLPGWKQTTTGATIFQQLPASARAYINQIEHWLDLPVVMISNGQDRKQLITRRKVF
ncbi:MAG: adenylosuccinate synthase [Kiritimatiellae bacterium]|nr:adenylosuccinate synthase [Kiritimatiellia bacterium]